MQSLCVNRPTVVGRLHDVAKQPTVRDVIALLDHRFDPATSQEWDRVGLVVGDPSRTCSSVLFAVDPHAHVVDEAVTGGYDLLVVHHPLLLRGVHTVATSTGKGQIIQRLIKNDCGLLTMHTNADAALDGVNDALADAVGMAASRRPIVATSQPPMAHVSCFVPPEHTDTVIAALSGAGAGAVGDYDFCAYWVDGTGQFRPLPGADPHVGSVGVLERVNERRLEMVVPRVRVHDVVQALHIAHPYEQPAFTVTDQIEMPGATGMGRRGSVDPTTLQGLAQQLHDALPATAHGVRVAGDPQQPINTVAVCGGSGDSLLPEVTDVDAYITSDLRHHLASDFTADGRTALLDIAHWAGESLWLQTAAAQLVADAAAVDFAVRAHVSTINTDPWTFRIGANTA